MNYKMMGRFLSQVLTIEGVFMIPALVISLFARETGAVRGFLMTLAVIALLALFLRLVCRSSPSAFYAREGLVCVGMSWMQTMFHVILPQAFRTAFPPLSNSLISMLKDTSLAANITVMEMFMVTQRIASRYYEHLALYIEVALIYLLFCTVLTKVQAVCEKRLATYGF